MSKPLLFEEIEEGQFFISFPVDGDDSGHGGYRKGSYVFCKIVEDSDHNNAERLIDGVLNHWSKNMEVYLVHF